MKLISKFAALAITLDARAQLNNELCFGGQTSSGIVQISQCKFAMNHILDTGNVTIHPMAVMITRICAKEMTDQPKDLTLEMDRDFCLKYHLNIFLLFCFITLQMKLFGF